MIESLLRPRIIARLDIKNGNLIKTIQLEGLRKLGNPQQFANKYYKSNVDEIILIDMVASLFGRNNSFSILEEIVQECFVPVTIGGGIRDFKDASTAFRAGADKIAINTAAFEDLNFIRSLVQEYGSQAIIGSVQAKKNDNGGWRAFSEAGRTPQHENVCDWVKILEDAGVGELLITSIDQEGTRKGFDIKLAKSLNGLLSIPVILSGGCGSKAHVAEALGLDSVDALAIAGAFHYGLLDPLEVVNS